MGSGIRRCRTRCCTSRRGPTETRSARNHRYQWGRSGRLEDIIRTERIQSFSTHWSYLPAVCLSESRDEDITQPAGRARLAAVGVFRKLSRALESRATPPPWLLGLAIARSCAKRPTSVAGLAERPGAHRSEHPVGEMG